MWLQKPILLICALVIFNVLHGCAGMRPAAPIEATIQGVPGRFKMGQIVNLQTGTALSFEQLIDQVAPKDLIFIGEVHDNPEHHLIQVQILEALVDCCGPVTVAMEFFQRPQQPFLDRYLQGEVRESAFLKEVGWRRAWGLDYHFYRPLMLLAKQNHSEILAINAPNKIVRKVARQGLGSLSDVERSRIAAEIDIKNQAHRDYVRKAYAQHDHGGLKNFDHFYEAQCVWEDTMAQNLAEYLKENGKKLIVFSGNGHIIYKFGIPNRTVKRAPVSMVTIMPYALSEKETIKKGTADYIWITGDYAHRPEIFTKGKAKE